MIRFIPQIAFSLLFVYLFYVYSTIHKNTTTWYFDLFVSIRMAMTGIDILSIAFQIYFLFASGLFCLYGIIRVRGNEVHVFSHLRFWLANFFSALIGIIYYQILIRIIHSNGILVFIVAGIISLAGIAVSGMLQATVVVIFDKIGKEPMIKDFARSMKIGKMGDCNSWIIRRWGQFLLLWFILIPGLTLQAPIPLWLCAILFIPTTIIPLFTLARSLPYYV